MQMGVLSHCPVYFETDCSLGGATPIGHWFLHWHIQYIHSHFVLVCDQEHGEIILAFPWLNMKKLYVVI